MFVIPFQNIRSLKYKVVILYFWRRGSFFSPSFKAVLDISHGEGPKKRIHFQIDTKSQFSALFFSFKKASVLFKKLAHMNFLTK